MDGSEGEVVGDEKEEVGFGLGCAEGWDGCSGGGGFEEVAAGEGHGLARIVGNSGDTFDYCLN